MTKSIHCMTEAYPDMRASFSVVFQCASVPQVVFQRLPYIEREVQVPYPFQLVWGGRTQLSAGCLVNSF